jgi:hypothetical protein
MNDDCFASDYPHPGAKYPNAVATFMKLLRANARRLTASEGREEDALGQQ